MGRQRRLLAQAVALVALTAAFAGSTSVFNSTYQAQAEVDARLTNGADVTVTESPGTRRDPGAGPARSSGTCPAWPASSHCSTASPTSAPTCRTCSACARRRSAAKASSRTRGFRAAPPTSLMSILAQRPDAILVSQETVHDYQLHPGDRLNLRLQDGRTHRAYHRTVPLRGRRPGVPDRSEGLVLRRQPVLRGRAHRVGRGRPVPHPDRRHQPRHGRRARPAHGRHRRPGDQHRRSAPGHRLQPDRRRAVGTDADRARRSRSCSQ